MVCQKGPIFVRRTTSVPTASEAGGSKISVVCHGGWRRANASFASWNANTVSALAPIRISFTNRMGAERRLLDGLCARQAEPMNRCARPELIEPVFDQLPERCVLDAE